MCDGEGPTLWSEKWSRARKAHKCIACTTAIQAGDFYWSFSGLWDGEWNHGKQCAGCHAIYSFLSGQSSDPVMLDLDCGETWEGDPEAHALALWTRDEGQAYAAARIAAIAKRKADDAEIRANHRRTSPALGWRWA